MKKMILFLTPVLGLILCLSCNKKVNPSQSAAAKTVNAADYMPFSKALKYSLEMNHADLKKIQFYVDQELILRRTNGVEKGIIKGGTVAYDNGQTVTEITIPAYTPGVCEFISGDSLMVSFDEPGNKFVFGALYANENFMLLGTNWYNGVTDINYDSKIYKVQCGTCGNAGDARLMIRRNQAGYNTPRESGGVKVVAGRKVN